ncbi:UDP-N-acetylmuramate--L-alanine ligase [Nitratifractor salsuginis]|uniref:UDP-N-acetylmuramate--L-alanine ligase n=1 Tax=Nitratifractor salsuginis (strain DSM 16511 / JCM 12458 / E9I37-1) TaxID=749222 RepID=E6X2W6_NITSE|nr:UDP-N-acetylmuramate--L-alanine ligase [Nitratifractor salsuginis]ADV47249.1 UDP-N-acetylmuramate--L-alanine ligase [Nitratifractor salsuginis DSM 16511]
MRIHFIGIGGIGLSALAKFLAGRGHRISGSDMRQSEITDDLALNYGAKITIPHHPDAVEGADRVIYSAAVRPSNVEYQRAKELGIELLSRKEALKFILEDKEVYAVGGAHGKSTTSAMLASLLPETNALIGAISKEFGSNVRSAPNDKVVFEADESDESFLNSNPKLAIVTNVEPEHMEYYEYDEERFYNAYRKFLELAHIRVLNGEDPFLYSLKEELPSSYLYPSRDLNNIEFVLVDGEPHTRFELRDLGRFEVFGFGTHIAVDAALAILAAMELGEDPETLRERLKNYRGIKKRFDIIQNDEHCVVIDDYGHHPTEIAATLESLRTFAKMRGLSKFKVIWQPHKYTRTLDNLKGFVECFEGVDELVILPIWSAGEIEIPIDLKGAFSRYEPTMAHRVTREDGIVKVLDEKGQVLREFREGLIAAFGAGDITYQIRGER